MGSSDGATTTTSHLIPAQPLGDQSEQSVRNFTGHQRDDNLSIDSWFRFQPDTSMSNMSDQTKQELMAHGGVGGVGGPANNGNASVQINHTMPISENIRSNGSTSRSKPQGCKICGKMLSSASSYYVHMKLHSGTKPYRCGVSRFVLECVWVDRNLLWPLCPSLFLIATGLWGCVLQKTLLGSPHANAHWGTSLPMQPLLEAVLTEVLPEHAQKDTHG